MGIKSSRRIPGSRSDRLPDRGKFGEAPKGYAVGTAIVKTSIRSQHGGRKKE